MTPQREAQLLEVTNLLLNARRTKVALAALPGELAPVSMEESFWVQDQMIGDFGEVGGWKVGAPTAEATPMFCGMPRAWMAASGSEFKGLRFRGLEAEIAFLLGEDLPAREAAYSDEEVYAAVASCHPAIEVLESGLVDPLVPELRLQMIADLQMHGGFVYGAAVEGWRGVDWTAETVSMAVDGSIRVERVGSNTSGDLRRLLPWLANHGAARTGGLRAGQWVTTGSWTGVETATTNAVADARFGTAGMVGVRFAG
jgi:2-keto-4-pentenoate hydratase